MNNQTPASSALKLSDLHVRVDNIIALGTKLHQETEKFLTATEAMGIDCAREVQSMKDGSTILEPTSDWLLRLKKAIVIKKYEAMQESALSERPAQIKTKSRIGNFLSTCGELIG